MNDKFTRIKWFDIKKEEPTFEGYNTIVVQLKNIPVEAQKNNITVAHVDGLYNFLKPNISKWFPIINRD